MPRKKEKKKSRFVFFLRGTNREKYLICFALTFAFAILILLVVLLTSTIRESENLKLENSIEKSFNSILFDLLQGEASTNKILSDENILGVAVYDSDGAVISSWGRVYTLFPLSRFSAELAGSAVAMEYNSRLEIMEYIRYIRLPSITPSVGYGSESGVYSLAGIDSASIMYIVFNGADYEREQRRLNTVMGFVIIGVICLYAFVLRMYLENRRYKEQMVKQENLVNLGQAARTLAHEIKNPLSAITIQIALLKRQLPDEYRDDLQLMEHETERLIQLTNRISDFLKNPQGQPEQIDLAQMINSLIPLFAFEIKIVPNSEKQAYILFDPERLRSVFENLLKNAVESCEGRDPEVEVEIVLGRKNVYHVFIRDRGDGIKKGDVEKLFDPFYTTKIHGSGIGLSISRQFLASRGGDIKLYPRDGGGTVVEVTIARYSLVEELITQGPHISKRKKKRGRKTDESADSR